MVAADAVAPVQISRVTMLVCPAEDTTDSVALKMLLQSLSPAPWDIEEVALGTLTSELIDRIALAPPAIVYIAALPPRGLSHARYLCKRLRKNSPQLQIVVGRWGQNRYRTLEREQLETAGANFVTTSLAETTQLLLSRLPLLRRGVSIAIEPALASLIPQGGNGVLRTAELD